MPQSVAYEEILEGRVFRAKSTITISCPDHGRKRFQNYV